MMDIEKWKNRIQRIKYPLLILALGLVLLLMPSSNAKKSEISTEDGLQRILNQTEGVGRCCVLISEHGVIVVCEGAFDAAVKLDILRAVGSYTGFGSDKITILRLAEE
jgi:hypothetical protein